MKLIDLNLLLYAVNTDSATHRQAKAWLEEVLSGDELMAIPWVVLLGFLRIATNSRIFPNPLEVTQAFKLVDGWLTQPNVQLLSPKMRHWPILRSLVHESRSCRKSDHRESPSGGPGHRKRRGIVFHG